MKITTNCYHGEEADESAEFRKAEWTDAGRIYQMKKKVFHSLHEKYRKIDAVFGVDPLSKMEQQIRKGDGDYWLLVWESKEVGVLRVVKEAGGLAVINLFFLLPEYQNLGIGSKFLILLEKRYPEISTWKLDVIREEEGLCRFYERAGFLKNGKKENLWNDTALLGYEKRILDVQKFAEKDAKEISILLKENCSCSDNKDYRKDIHMEQVKHYGTQHICAIAACVPAYVFRIESRITAFGFVWKENPEISGHVILSSFVRHPNQNKGICRQVIRRLEEDPLFTGAVSKEIASSTSSWDLLYQLSGLAVCIQGENSEPLLRKRCFYPVHKSVSNKVTA